MSNKVDPDPDFNTFSVFKTKKNSADGGNVIFSSLFGNLLHFSSESKNSDSNSKRNEGVLIHSSNR